MKAHSTSIRLSREDVLFNVIIYTIGAVLLVLVLYPLLYVVSASVSDPVDVISGKLVLMPHSFSLAAYREVFKNADLLIGYRNTILYAFVGTAINLIMTIAAAYPLSRPDLFGRNLVTFFISFTMFFGGGMIPTYINIKSLGLLDTFWVMVIPGAISATNMIIMRNYFQHSVPQEIVEAAYVDGCSNIRTLTSIVLPISMSIVAVIIIFYFVGHWNAYFDAMLYLNDRSKYPLQVFLRQILIKNTLGDMSGGGESSSQAEMALMSEVLKYAIIIVSSIPVLVMYPFMQRYFVKGIMMGSLKG